MNIPAGIPDFATPQASWGTSLSACSDALKVACAAATTLLHATRPCSVFKVWNSDLCIHMIMQFVMKTLQKKKKGKKIHVWHFPLNVKTGRAAKR